LPSFEHDILPVPATRFDLPTQISPRALANLWLSEQGLACAPHESALAKIDEQKVDWGSDFDELVELFGGVADSAGREMMVIGDEVSHANVLGPSGQPGGICLGLVLGKVPALILRDAFPMALPAADDDVEPKGSARTWLAGPAHPQHPRGSLRFRFRRQEKIADPSGAWQLVPYDCGRLRCGESAVLTALEKKVPEWKNDEECTGVTIFERHIAPDDKVSLHTFSRNGSGARHHCYKRSGDTHEIALVHSTGHWQLGGVHAGDGVTDLYPLLRVDKPVISLPKNTLTYPQKPSAWTHWEQLFLGADYGELDGETWDTWEAIAKRLDSCFAGKYRHVIPAGLPVPVRDDPRVAHLAGWASWHRTNVLVLWKGREHFRITPTYNTPCHASARPGRAIFVELGDHGARHWFSRERASRGNLAFKEVFNGLPWSPHEVISDLHNDYSRAPRALSAGPRLEHPPKSARLKKTTLDRWVHYMPWLRSPATWSALRKYYKGWNLPARPPLGIPEGDEPWLVELERETISLAVGKRASLWGQFQTAWRIATGKAVPASLSQQTRGALRLDNRGAFDSLCVDRKARATRPRSASLLSPRTT
jgi:hypothetical protein